MNPLSGCGKIVRISKIVPLGFVLFVINTGQEMPKILIDTDILIDVARSV
jgi:hypothetical protein